MKQTKNMSKKHKIKEGELLDEVPTLEVPVDEYVEQQPVNIEWNPGHTEIRFVVIRDGLRVSDKDYPISTDTRAIYERDFWQKVVKNWPDGTKVEIVQYEKKKHRIW